MTSKLGSSLRNHLPSAIFSGAIFTIVLFLGAAFVYFGVYNIAADAPHSRPVFALLENLRNRSIAIHARDITAPADLDSAERLSVGAGLYGEMCSGCHLAPGMEETEISQGLYPQAPELGRGTDLSAAQQFWIVKHGVKLTAMPAWGRTHSDTLIWDMVAFVKKLPAMSHQDYKAAIAGAPADHDEMMKDMPMMNDHGDKKSD